MRDSLDHEDIPLLDGFPLHDPGLDLGQAFLQPLRGFPPLEVERDADLLVGGRGQPRERREKNTNQECPKAKHLVGLSKKQGLTSITGKEIICQNEKNGQ
ncbi:MAG: hypothetical protein D4R65_11585 [Verrucomicrobiaceae bacterium]|nr:MAG: hypothetical protein D4R65_11585 [Verrucomicrobiaceae bacterium]